MIVLYFIDVNICCRDKYRLHHSNKTCWLHYQAKCKWGGGECAVIHIKTNIDLHLYSSLQLFV